MKEPSERQLRNEAEGHTHHLIRNSAPNSAANARPRQAAQEPTVHILGRLEISHIQESIRLEAPKVRLILAILAKNSPHVVRTDKLIDSVWGERPPPSARHNLHLYIHRLRQGLGNDRLINQRGVGYGLKLGRGEVDAHRFNDSLSTAQNAIRASDWVRAARLLREALAEWRGSPFAEFRDHPALRQESTRLVELHLQAIEHQADVDLALGDFAHLVGILRPLINANPYREKFHEQLAHTLYRLGRPFDAVNACRNARQIFREDLGIDVGPRLRRLERAILNNSVAHQMDVPA